MGASPNRPLLLKTLTGTSGFCKNRKSLLKFSSSIALRAIAPPLPFAMPLLTIPQIVGEVVEYYIIHIHPENTRENTLCKANLIAFIDNYFTAEGDGVIRFICLQKSIYCSILDIDIGGSIDISINRCRL